MKVDTGVTRMRDGIKERVMVEIYEARYPYRHMVRKVWGEPISRHSKAYRAIKSDLHDDWDSDITDSWYMPGNFTYSEMEAITKALSE